MSTNDLSKVSAILKGPKYEGSLVYDQSTGDTVRDMVNVLIPGGRSSVATVTRDGEACSFTTALVPGNVYLIRIRDQTHPSSADAVLHPQRSESLGRDKWSCRVM